MIKENNRNPKSIYLMALAHYHEINSFISPILNNNGFDVNTYKQLLNILEINSTLIEICKKEAAKE